MTPSVATYRPRHFEFIDVWSVAGIDFKVYVITPEGEHNDPLRLLAPARAYIEETLPVALSEEGLSHGLGYVILHTGEMGNWLLIHWWAHQDIAMRLLACANLGRTNFCSQDEKRFHACVWEHVVIDHERDAWVRTMMREESDPKLYLADRLSDGSY